MECLLWLTQNLTFLQAAGMAESIVRCKLRIRRCCRQPPYLLAQNLK